MCRDFRGGERPFVEVPTDRAKVSAFIRDFLIRLPAAGDPLGEVGALGADGGVRAMAG